MRVTLERPEHKLRDLARNILGKTSAELGELDMYQVGQLFRERSMTFTPDQIGNVTYRRLREWGAYNLLPHCSPYERHMSQDVTLFLVHDSKGNVMLGSMKDEGNYFPCTFTSLEEGPLFNYAAAPFILRHSNPDVLWSIRPSVQPSPPQGGEVPRITHSAGITVYQQKDKQNSLCCGKAILKAYTRQKPNARVGYGILSPRTDGTYDERPFFGLPREDIQSDPSAIWADSYVADMRGAMAQMGNNVHVPPQTDFITESRGRKKLQFIHANGMVFSIPEAGIFMRMVPPLRNGGVHVIFVYDAQGEVFQVEIRYPEPSRRSIEVTPARLIRQFTERSSAFSFYVRTPGMDGVIAISPSFITGPRGEYDIARR
jgi:hypothetical protein